MKLAICDDNNLFLEEFRGYFLKDNRISEVITYNDPNMLLRDVENKTFEIDAVFMDIDMGDYKSGISYAGELYKVDPSIQIVYITGYRNEYEQEIFLHESNLTGYITKPVDKVIFSKYIDKIHRKLNMDNNTLSFSIRGKENIVPVNEILFLESDNHKTIIRTKYKSYNVYEKLGDIESRLPDWFIRCHKSYLVNPEMVNNFNGMNVEIGDVTIPISRAHKESAKIKYFDYIGGQL